MTAQKKLAWLHDLKTLLNEDQVSTGESVLWSHAKGESFDEAVMPDVVVFPESTGDVQKIMAFAFEEAVPVTPVAVNSSLEGHTVPLEGGISLDMTRMDRILEVRPEDLMIVTQPAVTYPQINERVGRSGLFFPIDPGAHASIGGMIATNASGTMAVRYGVTADYVLALEVVTPTGELIRVGSSARKSSSGYNLKRLYCGSEGTLGVITEVSLRLVGLPEATRAARVPFQNLRLATEFVTTLIQAGVSVARCELVDAKSIRAVNAHTGAHYPEEPTIFLEFQGNPKGIEAELDLARALAQEHRSSAFESAQDADARAKLWEARHNMYYACVAANPGKRNLTTDVAVPISKLPEALTSTLEACDEARLDAYVVGHVGDGNFHLLVFFEDEEAERVEAVNHAMVMRAIHLGGTATGEHGVGIRKLKYMDAEHGKALTIMRAIKQTLDPKNIMNPGKKLPALKP